MAAKLVAEEGILKGLVLSLEDGDQWVIGRDPDACQLLVEDPSASRKHLICRATSKGILVENLSETNPIQVNEEEVKEPRLLHNGDAVKIGDGTFRFYAEAAAHLFNEDEEKRFALTSTPTENNPVEEPFLVNEQKATEIESENESENPPEEKQSLFQEEPKKNGSVDEDQATEELPPKPEPHEETQEPIMPLSKETTLADQPPEAQSLTDSKDFPHPPSLQEEVGSDGEKRHDSIFDEEPSDQHALAEINFGLLDTGRWLLKVISGPNNGAEFSMLTGNSYIIGTDPNACDIVFHDTSVSRQHTRITVNQDDTLLIEDLKSRNGTLVNGEQLHGKLTLTSHSLVAVGTTSFMIFDREGEMQTIISPLMPSIVKVLQTEESKKTDQANPNPSVETALNSPSIATQSLQESTKPLHQHHSNLAAFILIAILTGLFVIVGIGTSTLFKSEPVAIVQIADTTKALGSALDPFPSVKYSYNQSTGQLLLVGHVLTTTDKSQLLYALQGLNFIKNLDDSGVIIDEYVWREINQVLEKNPEWKGINIMALTPGHFVVTGYLQTRNQADRLSEYLSANFPYPDLLENRTVVDQEIMTFIHAILQSKGLKAVVVKLDNGEVTLTGGVPNDKLGEMASIINQIKEIRGIRNVRNSISEQAPEQSLVNISDKYEVTGISNQGGKMSVVINGRILMQGDALDGMTLTSIQPSIIYLEREGTKYRIDYNR